MGVEEPESEPESEQLSALTLLRDTADVGRSLSLTLIQRLGVSFQPRAPPDFATHTHTYTGPRPSLIPLRKQQWQVAEDCLQDSVEGATEGDHMSAAGSSDWSRAEKNSK